MRIPLERQGDRPLYQQIRSHLREGILSGALRPETRLPATRRLARDLGISRITVENAYAELEADGLIESRVGSGTFVMPPGAGLQPVEPPKAAAWPLWQEELAASRALPEVGASDERGSAAPHPDPVSFAEGIGDPRLFPVEEFRKVLQTVMRRDGNDALGYGDPRGHRPLRRTIAHLLASQGLHTEPERVLITAGSQQAIAMIAQVLLSPGDVVLVESPTYAGALDLFRSLGLKVVGAPLDDDGLLVDELEPLLQQHHPKLIYTIPNFHNPTGACLSGARRRQLIALAGRYNVPILEDDFVGDLRYEGRALPTLKTLDPGGRVLYVSTFSKMLMPGLRIGFLVADGPVLDALTRFSKASVVTTSNLTQHALEEYVTVGRYRAHLNRCRQLYRRRRDAMLQAIARELPEGVEVERARGGLFLWMRLPPGTSADALLAPARDLGVDFAPGSRFHPEDGLTDASGRERLRLNFTTLAPERIEIGIRRLAEALAGNDGRR